MKIPSLHRRRQQGNLLLAIIVVIALVIAIVVAAYYFNKWINKLLPAKPAGQGQTTSQIQAALQQFEAETLALYTYPGMTTTIQSAAIVRLPAFIPFPDYTNGEAIQRTTNWLDWETVEQYQPLGEPYADTNQFSAAFYRLQ